MKLFRSKSERLLDRLVSAYVAEVKRRASLWGRPLTSAELGMFHRGIWESATHRASRGGIGFGSPDGVWLGEQACLLAAAEAVGASGPAAIDAYRERAAAKLSGELARMLYDGRSNPDLPDSYYLKRLDQYGGMVERMGLDEMPSGSRLPERLVELKRMMSD